MCFVFRRSNCRRISSTHELRSISPFDDGYWDARFVSPDVPVIHRLLLDDADQLFVNGPFSTFSGVVAGSIVKWDGAEWSGIPRIGTIIGVDLSGNVYATRSAGRGDAELLKWDGVEWVVIYYSQYLPWIRVAPRRDGSIILATCSPPCGSFCPSWTGTPLHLLRDGVLREITDQMDCGHNLLLSRDDDVYNVIDGNVVRWDDDAQGWGFVAGPVQSGYATARTVDSDGNAYALQSEGPETHRLLRWADTTWLEIEYPIPVSQAGPLRTGSNGEIYVALKNDSSSTIYSLNGASWTQIGSRLIGTVNAMAIDSHGVIYAGGDFRDQASGAMNLVRWSAGRWESFVQKGVGSRGPTIVYSDEETNIFVDGAFPNQGLWEWTGDEFNLVTDSKRVNRVKGQRITPAFFGANDWTDVDWPACPIAGQEQRGWHVERFQRDESIYARLSCYRQVNASPTHEIIILHWDNPGWTIIGRGLSRPDARHHAFLASTYLHSSGELYVSGRFTDVNGESMKGIARWDGSNWHALGSGLGDPINVVGYANSFLEYGEKLIVGGTFLNAGDLEVGYIAAWNGAAWERFGHFNEPVSILAQHPELGLYAAGHFESSASRITKHIAQWDGKGWDHVGGGIAGEGGGIAGTKVTSIAFEGSKAIWFGGSFQTAGAVGSHNIARWIPDSRANLDREDYDVQAYPNPSTGKFSVGFTSSISGRATMELFDLTGKLVASVYSGHVMLGETKTITASLDGLAPGVYLLALRLPDRFESRKVVILGR